MSNVYEKAIYKQRKEYLANYYQNHKEDISRKAHERYEAKKKQKELEREGIKTQMCTKYCKYVDDAEFGYMSRQMLQEICKRCPMSQL